METTEYEKTEFQLFQEEFSAFGTYNPETKKYTNGIAFDFDAECKSAKVNVDDILAELILPDPPLLSSDNPVEKRKGELFKSILETRYSAPAWIFIPGTTEPEREARINWISKNVTTPNKISVLSEVQSLFINDANPYPDDVFKARKQKSNRKEACKTHGKKHIEKYNDFLTRLETAIKQHETQISANTNTISDLSKGVAGKETIATVTTDAAGQITRLLAENETLKKELQQLRSLYLQARLQLEIFETAITNSLEKNNIFEKDEASKDAKDDKSENKSSTSSVKSPYSSLSDRGKQASDKEEAKDLYQSFASASQQNKFLMLTGPDAKIMLEIARNLAKVGDRKDLQEYCQSSLDSDFIKYNGATLDSITISLGGGRTLTFPDLSKTKLKEGLLEKDIDDIGKLFEKLCTVKLSSLSVDDLAKLQNYSNALLISTTLQEAKWSKSKQITKGWLNFAGRKKTPNYDLGIAVTSLMRPLQERKDKIFKEINKEVDKGVPTAANQKYGKSTVVYHEHRKFSDVRDVRDFDDD